MKWYENNYRRHLCDMHIDDWDHAFLSEFHAETYYANLKRANVTAAMIYLQSHIGVCYYPTKVGHVHKAFRGREYEMKKLIDLCRNNGIRVVGYYSWIHNSIEHDAHPEWKLIESDGLSSRDRGGRYGFCCPNNPEYQGFVREQIREMAEYTPVDGMFFDMPYWPRACYCKHCQERWEREQGGSLPLPEDERWPLFQQVRKDWLGEMSKELAAYTKDIFGDISVELNYANAALQTKYALISEKVSEACDYVGGDISRDFLTQSFACKYFYAATYNQPFEYMTIRCNPDLQAHTITKSMDKLKLGVMLTCAHHGASLMIDAIDPVGTMDARFYEKLGEIYQEEAPYEPYLSGKMRTDVGVYFHYGAKHHPLGREYSNYTGSMNAVKAMIEAHIPVGIIPSEHRSPLDQYKFIILSAPTALTAEMNQELIDYVKNGGTLYFSDACQKELLAELVGGTLVGYTDHTKTYVGAQEGYLKLLSGYSMKYPLPFSASLPVITGVEDACVAAKIVLPYTRQNERKCASIHSNPPGIPTEHPALVIKPYGKGTVIWSAAPLENESVLDYKQILERLVRTYAAGQITVESNASRMVELVTFEDEDAVRVSAVCLIDSDFTVVQPSFTITLHTDKKVQEVCLLPERTPVEFSQRDDKVSFSARELNIFDMYEIKF